VLGAGMEGATCWIALQWIESESLAGIIARNGPAGVADWRDALRLMLDLGQALEYLHGQHVVHRNVCPTSVLIRAHDRGALLGDPLLAKTLDDPSGTRSRTSRKRMKINLAQQLSGSGDLASSFAYLPPERTLGQSAADPRADLYGLGASVYAYLLSVPPFSGDSLPEVVQKMRSAEPEPPRQRRPDIPPAFEAAVRKLLAKQPEERYSSATELLAHLRPLAAGAGIPME
jgi:serine/threonine-protein kinase